MAKKKFLSHTQFYELTEWLKRQSVAELDGCSMVDVAKLAFYGLNFEVSAYSVSEAAKVAGIEWHNPHSKSCKDQRRIAELEARIDRLENAVNGRFGVDVESVGVCA
jgi:hypothetical protein